MSVERSSSLFDPRFPTYVRALIVCGVILGVMLLVGAKFEFAKKMGWVKFRRKGMFSIDQKNDRYLMSVYHLKYNLN